MANPGYVNSVDGSDADDGSTWALANATLTGAITDASAGNRIWVSDNHAETTAAAVTLTFPGTLASPNQVLCGDDAAEPPTALAATASVTSTGANTITIRGVAYIYGHIFNSATGAGNQILSISDAPGNYIYAETCEFHCISTGATGGIRIGAAGIAGITTADLVNCVLRFSAVGQSLYVCGRATIRGGSASASGSDPNSFCDPTNSAGEGFDLLVDGFDFTNWGAGLDLVEGGAVVQPGRVVFRNCKLPGSWTGLLVSTPFTNNGFRAEMYNCDTTDTNYRLWVEDCGGSTKSETTIVRTDGASDGTTSISWKLDTSANAEYPMVRCVSPEIAVWVDSTGSKTFTVEFVHDTNVAAGQGAGASFAFQDDEWFLECESLGTSGFPLALFANDSKASVIATAADQTSSSVAWTTTGLTTPVKQKMSVTVTVNEKGYVLLRIVGTKASKTIYACPKVDVT